MITTTVAIDGTTWTITGDDQPNPLSPTPRITATANGTTVDLNCQYRQITATDHADGCQWGISLAGCTCAPRPTDTDALFLAARAVLNQCRESRDRAEVTTPTPRADDDRFATVPRGCDGCPSAIYGGPCTCC